VPRRKGISPVIATVIIVAVTIAVAIAVAFWMTGIVGLFTGFEQLQITAIHDDRNGIHLTVRNTGTSTAAITDVFVNNHPINQVNGQFQCGDNNQLAPDNPITLNPGQQVNCDLAFIAQPNQFTVQPGVSLEIKLHTAGGKDYPKLIVLQAYTAGAGGAGAGGG
jgi:flagellin-like protein